MEPYTVKELADVLNAMVKAGLGKRLVAVSADEECNSYHLLWYAPTFEPSEIREIMDCTPMDIGDHTAEDIILLG